MKSPVLHLLFCATLTLAHPSPNPQAQSNAEPQGLKLTDTCTPYHDKMVAALNAAHELAVSGYHASLDMTYLSHFFPPEDGLIIRHIYASIALFLAGHRPDVESSLTCTMDRTCTDEATGEATDVRAYIVYGEQNQGVADHVNICARELQDGSVPVDIDWCSVVGQAGIGMGKLGPVDSLGAFVLHELLHLPKFAMGMQIWDYAYTPDEMAALAAGEVKDEQGTVLSPTKNSASYVWMATNWMWNSVLNDPQACPSADKGNLRRILLEDGAILDVGAESNSTAVESSNGTTITSMGAAVNKTVNGKGDVIEGVGGKGYLVSN